MTEPEKRSYRFDRARRIKLQKDFRRVYQFRARVYDARVAICCRPTGEGNPARLGLSVAKKAVPKAHNRNRWKRLIREAFRLNFYEIPQGFDYIVIPQKLDHVPTYAQIVESILTQTTRASRKAARLEEQRRAAAANREAQDAAPRPEENAATSESAAQE